MKYHNSLLIFTVLLICWQSPLFAGSNAINQIISEEAAKKNMPVALVKAVIKTESSNNTYAVSPKGAMGLMQLMPKTAERFHVKDAFNPRQNIRAGIIYLKLLKKQFGTWPLALAAYNAGEGKVKKYGGIPPYKETRRYVVKVLSQYDSSLIPESLNIALSKKDSLSLTNNNGAVASEQDIYSSSLFFNIE